MKAAMMMEIYLAGPEVFLPDADVIFEKKKAICGDHGFKGVSPFDNEPPKRLRNPLKISGAIYRSNELAMKNCDLAIANVTPFRGISADPGTVLEIGFFLGQEKTVFAYTNVEEDYAVRVSKSAWAGGDLRQDCHGHKVENFELFDNLMIQHGVWESGGNVFIQSVTSNEDLYRDLTGFEKAVKAAQERVQGVGRLTAGGRIVAAGGRR